MAVRCRQRNRPHEQLRRWPAERTGRECSKVVALLGGSCVTSILSTSVARSMTYLSSGSASKGTLGAVSDRVAAASTLEEPKACAIHLSSAGSTRGVSGVVVRIGRSLQRCSV